MKVDKIVEVIKLIETNLVKELINIQDSTNLNADELFSFFRTPTVNITLEDDFVLPEKLLDMIILDTDGRTNLVDEYIKIVNDTVYLIKNKGQNPKYKDLMNKMYSLFASFLFSAFANLPNTTFHEIVNCFYDITETGLMDQQLKLCELLIKFKSDLYSREMEYVIEIEKSKKSL